MLMASSDVEIYSTSPDELDKEWQKFKIKFERKYKDEAEEARRKQIFKETLDRITSHNELYLKGLSTYYQGVNQFADRDSSEPPCGCMRPRSDIPAAEIPPSAGIGTSQNVNQIEKP